MLVSHHAPCDYDRTISFCGVRICVRCIGMLCGAFAGYGLAQFTYNCTFAQLMVASIGLTLPAAIDFTCHELVSKYHSSNIRRFVSGSLFGIPGGVAVTFAIHGRWKLLLFLLAFLALMQFAIATLFKLRGHMDPYVERYARAAIIDDFGQETSPAGLPDKAGAKSVLEM